MIRNCEYIVFDTYEKGGKMNISSPIVRSVNFCIGHLNLRRRSPLITELHFYEF
ncbi:hypothetical protein IX318_001490 [Porphyromonas levii]|nr:hypothetical protein [Porphyromonas levii]MBR8715619.1 hypothetical protein [Porphyromonas levii]MBR8728193.1 hypothetical protein [Porphyromonas levii]MBR8736547.1 hypothetical protein [Porphyromonas levii]MBR8764142.1 hypothetical protein [Porphyromonas levii]